MFKYNFKATGNTKHGQIELMFEDGPYKDISFVMYGMKFAEQENEDGSLNMSFDYDITITNNKEVDENFGNTLGDLIMHILEEQIREGDVVYKGGTDEGVINETASDSD